MATAAIDRERLLQQFLAFVQVDSPSYHEARFESLLCQELAALGLAVRNDGTGRDGAGNLLAVLPGTDPSLPTIVIGTHVDTVEPGRGIKPRIVDGYVVADGSTILGADNKSAVAGTLEAIRYLQATRPRHGDVEFLYTWGEELGLLGAAAFDASQLRSHFGFIADASQMAKVVTRGPYRSVLRATIIGKAAHAGGQADKGVNAIWAAAKAVAAMPLGQVDPETTANVGTIAGGDGINIVPERATLESEARSFDETKLERQLGVMRATLEAGAAAVGARVEYTCERRYDGYHLADNSPPVRIALAALAGIGIAAYTGSSAGGTDANHLTAKGIPCVVVGTGYEEIHSKRERIAVEDVVRTAQLIVGLVEESARQAC